MHTSDVIFLTAFLLSRLLLASYKGVHAAHYFGTYGKLFRKRDVERGGRKDDEDDTPDSDVYVNNGDGGDDASQRTVS